MLLTETEDTSSFGRQKGMGKTQEGRARFIARIFGALFVLAAAGLYVGVTELSKIQPASAYEERGVHPFSSYKSFPTQVKNTAGGRQQRMNPTKTVYLVCYRATDGSGYEWKDQVSSESAAEDRVAARESVERRVLSIKETGEYFTIDGGQTAESYVSGRRLRCLIMSGASTVYLVIYLIGWGIVSRKGRRKTAENKNG